MLTDTEHQIEIEDLETRSQRQGRLNVAFQKEQQRIEKLRRAKRWEQFIKENGLNKDFLKKNSLTLLVLIISIMLFIWK